MRITFSNNIDKVLEFVRVCEGFPEDIDVVAGRYVVDGKSILGVAGICTNKDLDVTINTDDMDRWVAFRIAMTPFLLEEN
jgi:phosphotransferase system HPr-like phosphotransfer protein